MRRNFILSVVLSGAAFLVPQTASAQGLQACTASLQSVMGYTSCSGAFAGNNKGTAANIAATASLLFGFNGFTATSVRSNDEGPFDLFTNGAGNGSTSGTWNFSPNVITGPFVLALKSNSAFSLFYYANTGSGVSVLNFNMAGVSENANGGVQALSHATIYRGRINGTPNVVVPEPSTYALMATGLVGLVGVARRRNAR